MTASTAPPGIQAVIFDISGTILDYGSRGPVVAFVELFSRYGVAVTNAEVRAHMGKPKKDHIDGLLREPNVAGRWEKAHGSGPTSADLDRLFDAFLPIQSDVIKRHCDVIPGVPELVEQLRVRGIKIANTTGFDTNMINDLIPLAARGGYSSDLWVGPDLVGGRGRPAPWMAFYAAGKLEVYPMSAILKVGDTVADIEEAHSAGMWSVAVVRHGNEVGMSEEALAQLPEIQIAERVKQARIRLAAKGPHYVIDSTGDLLEVIDQTNARLLRGERP
jgi:phosphonoacetaldehyde hydrolase